LWINSLDHILLIMILFFEAFRVEQYIFEWVVFFFNLEGDVQTSNRKRLTSRGILWIKCRTLDGRISEVHDLPLIRWRQTKKICVHSLIVGTREWSVSNDDPQFIFILCPTRWMWKLIPKSLLSYITQLSYSNEKLL
jgi:hypothetical protein